MDEHNDIVEAEIREDARVRVVPSGTKEADLMVIFSHPNLEDLRVRSFCNAGYATEEVRNALRAVGLNVDRCYFTAMYKYGIGSKPKPTAEQIAECADELDAEIAEVKPKLIMTMGAEVFKRIMKSNIKMGDYLGELIDSPYGKILPNFSAGMIVTQDPTKRPQFREIFDLARRYIDDKIDYDKFTYYYTDSVQENIDILQGYIDKGQFNIGYDAEWLGKKFTDDEVMYTFQYSLEKDFAVVLDISKDGVTENLELLNTMKLILEHPNARRMGWNIRADDLRLVYRGFNLSDETLAFDGMKAVAFFDSRLPKSLETGIKKFTNYDPYYVELTRKLKEHKIPGPELSRLKFLEPEVFKRYCAGDAVAHREACLNMMALFPDHLKDYYFNVYLPLSNYILDMEISGIPIDLKVMEEMTDKYTSKYEELKIRFNKLLKDKYDIDDFNPNSPPQKKDLLFKRLKLEPAYYTKAGKSPKSRAWYDTQKPATKRMYTPSTNGRSLSTMRFELDNLLKDETDNLVRQDLTDKRNVVSQLLDLGRINVFANKFLSKKGINLEEALEEEPEDDGEAPLKQSYWSAICKDGKIHSSFFECLKNFRASSSPNVQNPASKVLSYMPNIFVPGYSELPKENQEFLKDQLPANLRNIFYAGKEDFLFAELDVAGADLAIMAFLSQDPAFIEDIRKGSFHQTKMREYFQDANLTKKDVAKYVISKGITFRVSYTSGLKFAAMPIQADIMAENGILVPLEVIDYALATWHRYKAYMQYRDECNAQVKNYNSITNARGMTLFFEESDNFGIKAGWMNESLAFPVASELALFMWDASIRVRKLLKKEGLWMKYVYPTCIVHDANYWIVHKDLLKDNYLQEVLRDTFCKETKLATGDVVGCEVSIGRRWKSPKNELVYENETVWNPELQEWVWK